VCPFWCTHNDISEEDSVDISEQAAQKKQKTGEFKSFISQVWLTVSHIFH
jgi:hypothetical protein